MEESRTCMGSWDIHEGSRWREESRGSRGMQECVVGEVEAGGESVPRSLHGHSSPPDLPRSLLTHFSPGPPDFCLTAPNPEGGTGTVPCHHCYISQNQQATKENAEITWLRCAEDTWFLQGDPDFRECTEQECPPDAPVETTPPPPVDPPVDPPVEDTGREGPPDTTTTTTTTAPPPPPDPCNGGECDGQCVLSDLPECAGLRRRTYERLCGREQEDFTRRKGKQLSATP